MEPRGIEPLSESNLERVSPGAVCYLHSRIPAGTNTLRELVASLFMVRAKLSAHTVSTQITPEPGSWTFRGGWAPNQAAIATELLSVKFKKLPVLSWPGATARYSSLTTPVETSTAPEIVCHCETVRTLSWQSPGDSAEESPHGCANRFAATAKSEPPVGIRQLLGLRIGFPVGVYGDGSDLLLCHRPVVGAGLGGGDGIHHIHAGSDLAKGGILAVQMLGILMHDEELAACGVGRRGAGHAQHASFVLQFILHTVEEELALDAVAGAAHAGAVGAAALDHEAGNDPVEDQAVIEVMIAQIDEIIDALGGLIGVQLTLDDAAVFHGDLKRRIHWLSLLHGALDLPLGIPLCGGCALIVQFFALAQANLHLDPAALEIDGQGDQGIAVLLDLAVETHDLPLVHQQSSGTLLVPVEDVAVVIG